MFTSFWVKISQKPLLSPFSDEPENLTSGARDPIFFLQTPCFSENAVFLFWADFNQNYYGKRIDLMNKFGMNWDKTDELIVGRSVDFHSFNNFCLYFLTQCGLRLLILVTPFYTTAFPKFLPFGWTM